MKVIDFRDPQATAYEPQKTCVLLGGSLSCLFHWGRGNTVPWAVLKPKLEGKLDGALHPDLTDISIETAEVCLAPSLGNIADAVRISAGLVERGLAPRGAKVVIRHADGRSEPLGEVGQLADRAGAVVPLAA